MPSDSPYGVSAASAPRRRPCRTGRPARPARRPPRRRPAPSPGRRPARSAGRTDPRRCRRRPAARRRRPIAVTSAWIRSRCPASITGPSATWPVVGSPTGSGVGPRRERLDVRRRRRRTARGAGRPSCRPGPGGRTSPRRPTDDAASESTSSSTSSAELPPSSRCTRLRCWPASVADRAAGPGRAGERDHPYQRLGDQRLADVGGAGQHVQHARRQAGLLEQRREQRAAADGGARVGLEQHRVAQRQRRRDRADAEDRRHVERRDHADDADRHRRAIDSRGSAERSSSPYGAEASAAAS